MMGLAKIGMEWLQEPLIWLFVASVVFLELQRRRGMGPPLPPGPYSLPIVGNIFMMDQLTHWGFAALAKQYGGLLHLRLGKVHTFVDAGVRPGSAAGAGRRLLEPASYHGQNLPHLQPC